jgi:hypothetical protein
MVKVDVASLGAMTEKPTPQEVDAFLDSTLVDEDPALSAALQDSDAAGLPKIAVSFQQGKFLSLLAGTPRLRGPTWSAPVWAIGWRSRSAPPWIPCPRCRR